VVVPCYRNDRQYVGTRFVPLDGTNIAQVDTRAQKRPRHGDAPGPLVSELPTGGLARGHMPDQSKFLHSRYELGRLIAAISLGLLQALILSLGIADGFCQHLA
jgi:hypothetical protein